MSTEIKNQKSEKSGQEHRDVQRSESQATPESDAVPSLLEGVTVERVGIGNWHFVFPNNARSRMSMSDLLLWLVLIELQVIADRLTNGQRTNEQRDNNRP